MSGPCILVVEDDEDIRELLVFHLQREFFKVIQTDNGVAAVGFAVSEQPDLILLDLMLPKMDGLSVCKALAHNPKTASIPVIMLTAKGEEIDRVVGLELGAADYVVKPFSVREVLLRIRAVLRRNTPPSGQDTSEVLICGDLRLDRGSHTVYIGETLADLTATEFRLLEDLMRHTGKVRTREQLLDTVWGYQFEGYARTVDTHIRRLRIKLDDHADMIDTVRGVGYRIKETV